MRNIYKKLIPMFIVFAMLLNVFSPFTPVVNASVASGTTLTVKKSGILTEGGVKYIKVEIYMDETGVRAYDLNFKYDATKIQPMNHPDADPYEDEGTNYDVATNILEFMKINYDGVGTQIAPAMTNLNVGASTFKITAAGATQRNLSNRLMYSLYFKVIGTTTDDDITMDTLKLQPVATAPSGYSLAYNNGTIKDEDASHVSFVGFAASAKTVDHIKVKTLPTKKTYNHGESISLTGGEITVCYDAAETDTEDVLMTSADVAIVSGTPANVSNPTVKISYKNDKETTFNITVNDPVYSVALTTPPTNLQYDNGDTIDLSGAVLTATTNSGVVTTINLPDASVTPSSNKANLSLGTITGTGANSLPCGYQTITLTYSRENG